MNKDVYIFDTRDGGDVTLDLEIRDGLESSFYLSIFGGNSKDDGLEKNPFTWWGNIGETIQSRIYRSETAYLLRTIPPTSKNLQRIRDAANRDLAWVLTEGVCKTLDIQVSMPARNNVKIVINADGISPLEFQSFWGERDEGDFSILVPPPPEGDFSILVPPPPIVTINNAVILSGTGLANADLYLVLANGSVLTVPINNAGMWTISPYPLAVGEISTAYVKTKSGLASRGSIIVGVGALYYNGSVYYDGSQDYDGIKTWPQLKR